MPKIKKEKDGIFAIGEEEQKFLEEDFNFSRRSIPIIRCGVDTGKFFFSPAQRKKIRRNLKISKKEIVIVYAGKITPNKELEILFQAVSLLKFFNIRLLIIGGGPEGYFKKLEKIKSKGVIRLSFLENKDLSSYFSASDIGVWPGDPSVALLEAMACRLPVILPESVETQYLEESNGIMRFKRGNAKDLAEKIKLLVFDENLRKKFGKNGEKFIRDELSWQKIGKKTLNLVKNLKKSRNY